MKHIPITFSLTILASTAFSDTILTDSPAMLSLTSSLSLNTAQTEIGLILEENQSIHHFSLKPSQARKISDATDFVTIGAELFPQINTAFANLNPQANIITIESLLDHDPHFWMSPETVISAAKMIDGKLPNGDPSRERFQQFEQNMIALDEKLSEVTFDRGIIVGHNAFARFVAQYNVPFFGALTDIHETPAPPKKRQEIEEAITNGSANCLVLDTSEPSPELEKFATDNDIDFVYFDVLGWNFIETNPDQFFENYYDNLAQVFSECTTSQLVKLTDH